MLGYHHPWSRHPPDHTPPPDQTARDQTPPQSIHPLEQTPPEADPPIPPLGNGRQHTVNEQPVRILLECILVWQHFC